MYTRLREAAQAVSENGWMKGDLTNPFGKLCAIGAINLVWNGHARCYDHNYSLEDEKALAAVMVEQLGVTDTYEVLEPVAFTFAASTFRSSVALTTHREPRSPRDIIVSGNDDYIRSGNELVAIMEKAAVRREEEI